MTTWFYSYHNLQGSQTKKSPQTLLGVFYSYHNLQGSQTEYKDKENVMTFYSYHNLQGSQTTLSYQYYDYPVLLLS